jgi:hypothetical protein
MRKLARSLLGAVAVPLTVAATHLPPLMASCGPCRPRAGRPCNPCSVKSRKGACAPCQPCGAKNPCGPCGAGDLPVPKPSEVLRPVGTSPFKAKRSELLKLGQSLYADPKLSTNDLACSSCHSDGAGFNDTFKQPYPHQVQMPKDVSAIEAIDAEGMVQFCLVRPMMSTPLPWDSKELAALTAYVEEVQKDVAKR